MCFISSSYVNWNWSYGPETAELSFDLCDLDLWPMTLSFVRTSLLSLVITPKYFMMIRWQEHCEKVVTGHREIEGPTDTVEGGHALEKPPNPIHSCSLRYRGSINYKKEPTDKYIEQRYPTGHQHITSDSHFNIPTKTYGMHNHKGPQPSRIHLNWNIGKSRSPIISVNIN